MTVPADDDETWLGESLPGPDDVDDPLPPVGQRKEVDPRPATFRSNVSTIRRISGVGASASERLTVGT
jgi:hypothetical protein